MQKLTYRRFQGSRLEKAASRKNIASAWGVKRQTVDAAINKGQAGISYERLGQLARIPGGNPEAVVSGALAVIHEVRAKGDLATLAEGLSAWLTIEQQH